MLAQQYDKITSAGVRRLIEAALDTGDNGWVNRIAMPIESDQAVEEHAWLGETPALREFIGGRQPAEIKENSFQVRNIDYESSITFRSKDMRRDKLGVIQPKVDQLAERVLDHPAALLSRLLMSGESALCYDGQYFFDTDHPGAKDEIQSNSISAPAAVPTKPTADEIGEAVGDAIERMYDFTDDRGQPINQSAHGFLVMVPVHMLKATVKSFVTTTGAGGGETTMSALASKYSIEFVPNPRVKWTNKIAVLRVDASAKPFILQEDKGGRRVIDLGEGSEYEKLNNACFFGVDWCGNVAPAWWQHACLTTFVTP